MLNHRNQSARVNKPFWLVSVENQLFGVGIQKAGQLSLFWL